MTRAAKLNVLDVIQVGMLLFIPITLVLHFTHSNPTLVFFSACLAIIPLAGMMGTATEHAAAHTGEGVGALLSFTFGNAAELILAILGIREGIPEVVKASITGAIINNLLMVLGSCMVLGGRKRTHQTFNATAAGIGSTMMTVAVCALILPAVFHSVAPEQSKSVLVNLSDEIAVVMLIAYVFSLIFSLRTHKHLYMGKPDAEQAVEEDEPWSIRKAVTVLLVCSVAVAGIGELLIGAVEHTSHALGLSDMFVGIIILAVVGNASEHGTALRMALKDRMDLTIGIAIGGCIQIAMFVAPVLVLVSLAMGKPLDLVFNMAEVVAVALAVIIAGQVSQDGESNWLEGVQLLAVYSIMALVFYHMK